MTISPLFYPWCPLASSLPSLSHSSLDRSYAEASRAYSSLAEEATPLSASEPLDARHRSLELKINYLSMALRSSQDYGHVVVEEVALSYPPSYASPATHLVVYPPTFNVNRHSPCCVPAPP